MTTKVCTRCGLEKPLDQFPRNKKSKDGHAWICDACNYAQVKAWRVTHQANRREEARRYRAKNRKRTNGYVRKSYQKHKPEITSKLRQSRKENPEPFHEIEQRYRDGHRDELNARNRKSARENRKANSERHRIYVRTHREVINAIYHRRTAKRKGVGGSFTPQEWEWLLALCGNKCLCPCDLCDSTISKDHIDPNGPNIIENLQPLCKPCNASKSNRIIVDYRPRWLVDNFASLKAVAGFGGNSSENTGSTSTLCDQHGKVLQKCATRVGT